VRRCLGASFALFEMKQVLRAITRAVRLGPAEPASEGMTRRAITFVPDRGAEVIAADGRLMTDRHGHGVRDAGGFKPAGASADISNKIPT
jgi:hypothetical protein